MTEASAGEKGCLEPMSRVNPSKQHGVILRPQTSVHFANKRSRDTVQLATAIDQFRLADVKPDPGIQIRECFGNSVRCALELAILDAACRVENISIGQLMSQTSGHGEDCLGSR
jgi:hypothetical protein